MARRWRIVLELTFDVDDEKDVKRYEDDTDADLGARALARVRPELNKLVGKEKAFAHYHILEQPRKVAD